MASTLLTVPEAAARLAVKPRTLRDWILRRRIEYVKLPTGGVRIAEAVIERIIKAGTQPVMNLCRRNVA